MQRGRLGHVLWLALTSLLISAYSWAEVRITLRDSFIEQYKDRATIDATFTVDKAHKKPNPPKKDGDLHIAGRAPEVELPTVAEIMNAASVKDVVNQIHSMEGVGTSVAMKGAWRIWCEHGGDESHVQGQPLLPFDTTNPDHVFEIHPVTQLGVKALTNTLRPIKGYTPKDADDAFQRYETLGSKITHNEVKKTTTIVTGMAGYNYVKFQMELNEDPTGVVSDGRMVMAKVLDLDGELLVHNRRMVFVDGSAPDNAVTKLKKGNRLIVLGIPRINLKLVSWRVEHKDDPREPLTWNLPYEMIVVGVYNQP